MPVSDNSNALCRTASFTDDSPISEVTPGPRGANAVGLARATGYDSGTSRIKPAVLLVLLIVLVVGIVGIPNLRGVIVVALVTLGFPVLTILVGDFIDLRRPPQSRGRPD
jgi:hypothetical protein